MASMLGIAGATAPPYPMEGIWSTPTSSMMTNRMFGVAGSVTIGGLVRDELESHAETARASTAQRITNLNFTASST